MKSRFDGLSEFISRRGRMRILSLLLDELGTPIEVAKRLNITKNAVHGWLNDRKIHPSNENAQKMLKILEESNEKKLKDILVKELQIFQNSIINF